LRRLFAVALALLVASAQFASAQAAPVRATRPDGSVVLLNPNGTWTEAPSKSPTATAPAVRTRPSSATETIQLLKSATLSIDPAKWKQAPSTAPGRFGFSHMAGDGYAMVIAERIEMAPDALANMALTNAREAAPDARVVMDDSRIVNGTPVRCLQIVGTMQGISFKYFGYYYAGPAGTIQVITYTSTSLFDEFSSDFEGLLDGLVVGS